MIKSLIQSSKVLDRIRLFRRALGLIWEATGWLTALWMALLIIQGVLPAASVYLTKVLIDTLAENMGLGGGIEALKPLILPVSLLGCSLVAMQLVQGFIRWVRTAQAEYVQDYIKELVHAQAATVDLEFY